MTGVLLSALQRYLTPDLVGRAAAAIGLDPRVAQSAAAAAVPAILAGLARIAGEPDGPESLAGAAARAPSGLLDNLSGRLASDPNDLIQQGQSLITSLLGPGATSALTSSIARFTGGSEGSMRSLVGLLMPVILGVLGRQAAGGNGAGLARLLRSESGEFKAAMPSGLSSLLESSHFFESAGAEEMAGARERADTSEPRDYAARPAATPRTERTGSHWAYWALPLAALVAGLLGYMLGTERPREVTTAAVRGSDMASAMPAANYLRAPLSGENGEMLGTVQDLLVTPDGRIVAAVVGVERALGMGERRVAVPFSAIETRARNGGSQLVLRGSTNVLTEAPAYEPGAGATPPGSQPQNPGRMQ